MIPQTQIDWNAFKYKYSGNHEQAFEKLAYYLFCHEFNQKFGIFRYFNQPHIETEPIVDGNRKIGFQAKFYQDSVVMSSKESELIDAVKGAAASYHGINTLFFYISKEFSPSSRKGEVKPKYQLNIENAAENLGIEVVWKGLSNIEAQLLQNDDLKWCKNMFFQVNSEVEETCKKLEMHKEEIFRFIKTSMPFRDTEIILEHNKLDLQGFLRSKNQVLLIDGVAGSGKSALIKKIFSGKANEKTAILAFKSTDLDMKSEQEFMDLYGRLTWDEVLELYADAEDKILYLDAIEKYYVLEYNELLEMLVDKSISAGWKVVLSLRTAYKESLQNDFLRKYSMQEFTTRKLKYQDLKDISVQYGFSLPMDKKLLDILYVPFFLRMYLSLNHIDESEMTALNKERFREKVWEEVICNNRCRKDNMPARREQAIVDMTVKMLKEDVYLYKIEAQDDYEAFHKLEESGVIEQTEDARHYVHGHDVFEEMVIEHIFMEGYQHEESIGNLLILYRPTLRMRKLFRNWLIDCADTKEFQKSIFKTLCDSNVNTIWRDEILLAVVSTEELKDVFERLSTEMEKNNYELLKKMTRMVNTCCRNADFSYNYTRIGVLSPYRLAKPAGYAWKALLEYLYNRKSELCWDKEMLSIVIEMLYSWTMQAVNKKSDNTFLAGKVALFLLCKTQDDREQEKKLKEVILNSSFMIKQELSDIFGIVMESMKPIAANERFPFEPRRIYSAAPSYYTELAEMAVGNIEDCGNVPWALPELTLQLMEKLWINPFEFSEYDGHDMDDYFGLNSYVSSDCHPHSAYQTPIIALLREKQMLTTDFLINLCNKAGDAYFKSHLNRDYKECMTIIIHVDNQEIEQISSDRLWKMYRGTHVGPDLLISLLMGYESWLLDVVKNTDKNVVTEYFHYVLLKSTNVMLTAVIVSICECYPEKMIDIICDLLKTKEIFHLDISRLCHESQASFLLYGKNIYERERLESNKLQHRSVDMENIILIFQASDDENRKKIWKSIDEAVMDIETWLPEYKFPYYRMDVRRFTKKVTIKNESGEAVPGLVPEFTEEMVSQSISSRKNREKHLKYMDLQLWSDYKFQNNPDYAKYNKYEDVKVVLKELRMVDKALKKDRTDLSFRYLSCVSYTSAVLLRDYKESLDKNDILYCKNVLKQLGTYFVGVSYSEMIQAGNGLEAVTEGLCRMLNECVLEEKIEIRLLLLLLVMKNQSYESKVIEQIAKEIWSVNPSEGWLLLHAVSVMTEKFEEECKNNYKLQVSDFVKENEEMILELLDAEGEKFDISGLNLSTQFLLIMMTAPDSPAAVELICQTKYTLMQFTFGKKDRGRGKNNYIGFMYKYIDWFSQVLLMCSTPERKKLIEEYLSTAALAENDDNEYFLTVLLMNQEKLDKAEAFWEIWNEMRCNMISVGEQERVDHSHYEYPVGGDKLIISYLFGNANWVKGIKKCNLLSKERENFFTEFIENSKSIKAQMFAIGRLLYTAGKETYEDCGLKWIYSLVQKDPECKLTLYNNTLFYLEEYAGEYYERHKSELRSNTKILQQLQIVLEYLVNQGSIIAFFIREQI